MSKVSIIVPTFNRAETIFPTLMSIVNQSYDDIEVIIVDDGSTDDTEKIIGNYITKSRLEKKLFYFKQENGGPSKARNYGLKMASGDYIVFFDSDDIMVSNRVELQVNKMKEKNADLCAAGFTYLTSGYIQTYQNPIINNYFAFYRQGYLVGTQAWMFRKKSLDFIGGYNESIRYYEDIDLVLRVISFKGTLCCLSGSYSNFNDTMGGERLTNAKSNITEEYIKGLLVTRKTALDLHSSSGNNLALILEFNLIVNKRRDLNRRNKHQEVVALDELVKQSIAKKNMMAKLLYISIYRLIIITKKK